ncbi:hypothetical protein KKF84_11090, partial [Myxococcota bacterium]|nr:hypothetical protein [Myxococcota bacterium]MBU1535856.1 hypothetical protein [Myxococcota bacterium]
MSNKRLTEENRCPRCRLNTLWCYCDLLSNIAVSNKISAVVHSSELQYTSNTAHLLVSTLSTGRLYL